MKPGATREQIIEMTSGLIVRNGIRALRVDEIVQALGISKRTLYEMFVDKTNLITVCLRELAARQRQRMEQSPATVSEEPLRKLFGLLHAYLHSLYEVGGDFLTDIRHKTEYAALYGDFRSVWLQQLTAQLENCAAGDYLDASFDLPLLAQRLITSMLRNRLEGIPCEEQYLYCRLLIRGCARPKGIEWIDRMPATTLSAI